MSQRHPGGMALTGGTQGPREELLPVRLGVTAKAPPTTEQPLGLGSPQPVSRRQCPSQPHTGENWAPPQLICREGYA